MSKAQGWEARAREADGWRGPAEEGELASDPTHSQPREEPRVQLNKRTETAIDGDDREIVHFLCGVSSKKGIDIETIVLAE